MKNEIRTTRYGILAAVTVGTIAASVGLSGTARAATGNFTYFDSARVLRALIAPGEGYCIELLTQSGAETTNNTDKSVILFSNANCAYPVATVAAHTSTDVPALSVIFQL